MFGESGGGGSFYRCPGAGCELWEATGGDYEERKMVCLDCAKCKGKPPLLTQSNSPEAVQLRVVGRIESIVRRLNSGQPVDWDHYEYWEWQLVEIWRDAEQAHDRNFKLYTKALFEALTKSS